MEKGFGNLVTVTTDTLLRIHQYKIHMLYKPGPELYITDLLSRYNLSENKDEEISSMKLNIDVINIARTGGIYKN